jgi:hypothetical protein
VRFASEPVIGPPDSLDAPRNDEQDSADPLAPIAPALPQRICDVRSAALAHLHVANWHEVADTGLPSPQPRRRLRGLPGAPR